MKSGYPGTGARLVSGSSLLLYLPWRISSEVSIEVVSWCALNVVSWAVCWATNLHQMQLLIHPLHIVLVYHSPPFGLKFCQCCQSVPKICDRLPLVQRIAVSQVKQGLNRT